VVVVDSVVFDTSDVGVNWRAFLKVIGNHNMRLEGRIVVRYVWYLNLVAYSVLSSMNTNHVCNVLLFEQDVWYDGAAKVRIIDLLKFLTAARRPVKRQARTSRQTS
jgi:hypothetical protein